MRLSCLIVFVLLIAFQMEAAAQPVDFSKATDWKIYDVPKRSAFRIPTDSLKFFKSIRLEDGKVEGFLKQLTSVPQEKNYAWMGLYVASCRLGSDSLRKVIFSNYGGFIYDASTKSYYELPESIRQEWLTYINDNLTELRSKE